MLVDAGRHGLFRKVTEQLDVNPGINGGLCCCHHGVCCGRGLAVVRAGLSGCIEGGQLLLCGFVLGLELLRLVLELLRFLAGVGQHTEINRVLAVLRENNAVGCVLLILW